jgi:hypothetical protein
MQLFSSLICALGPCLKCMKLALGVPHGHFLPVYSNQAVKMMIKTLLLKIIWL